MLKTLSQIAAAARIAVGTSAASMILVISAIPAASAIPVASAGPAAASTLSVVVSAVSDSGPGSLRAAIATADASAPGTTTNISFSVAGTITLASALPAITGTVTVDGTSAPGYTAGGAPVVEIDCNDWAGLRFASGSDGSRLLGIAVANASGNGVTIGARSITLNDDYIGLNGNGTANGNRGAGVFVVPPQGNLISGNVANGVLIDRRSHGNVLNGNFIGTTADGDASLGNGGNGVWIHGPGGNSLIGCTFVNNPFVYYNIVSGNDQNGLRVTNSNNVTVQGNFFGIGANNTALVGNRLDGIRVGGSSASTQVGGVIPLGNVASGNGANGIAVTGRVRGFVTFNTFGGLLAFKGAAPNGNDGLLITSSRGGNLVRTNVFSGNRRNGIELARHEFGVLIDPNIVGLNTKGNGVLPNGGDGVRIDGDANGNKLGGTIHSVIPQNTFSGNKGYGLAIVGRAHSNLIERSFIGTKLLGVFGLGNSKGGILLGGRSYLNSIGSNHPRPSNLISGNTGNGITLRRGSHENRVIYNYIGLNRFRRCLRNTGRGLVIRGRATRTKGNRYSCRRRRAGVTGHPAARFQWHSVRDRARPGSRLRRG